MEETKNMEKEKSIMIWKDMNKFVEGIKNGIC